MIRKKIFAEISILLIRRIWQSKSVDAVKNHFNIHCRFIPSCSNYTILVLDKYGFWIGWYKGYKRIMRCLPDVPFGTPDYPEFMEEFQKPPI